MSSSTVTTRDSTWDDYKALTPKEIQCRLKYAVKDVRLTYLSTMQHMHDVDKLRMVDEVTVDMIKSTIKDLWTNCPTLENKGRIRRTAKILRRLLKNLKRGHRKSKRAIKSVSDLASDFYGKYSSYEHMHARFWTMKSSYRGNPEPELSTAEKIAMQHLTIIRENVHDLKTAYQTTIMKYQSSLKTMTSVKRVLYRLDYLCSDDNHSARGRERCRRHLTAAAAEE